MIINMHDSRQVCADSVPADAEDGEGGNFVGQPRVWRYDGPDQPRVQEVDIVVFRSDQQQKIQSGDNAEGYVCEGVCPLFGA